MTATSGQYASFLAKGGTGDFDAGSTTAMIAPELPRVKDVSVVVAAA